jgi:hypothetical protein
MSKDGIYQNDLTKGKGDWVNYQEKMKQIKNDRAADKKHNEDIAKRINKKK